MFPLSTINTEPVYSADIVRVERHYNHRRAYHLVTVTLPCWPFEAVSDTTVSDDASKRRDQTSSICLDRSQGITSSVEATMYQLIDNGVIIQSAYDVRSYLSENPDIIDALLFANSLAVETFGPNAERSLKINAEEGRAFLILDIRQTIYDDKFCENLTSIQQLYSPLLENTSGWLLVTSDFQEPGSK